jgi:hypothetical protein
VPEATIRYWGFLPLTKRNYLGMQALVLILLVVLSGFAFTLPPSPRFGLAEEKLPASARWLLDHIREIVLATTGLEVLDTVITLFAFRRKERAEASQTL